MRNWRPNLRHQLCSLQIQSLLVTISNTFLQVSIFTGTHSSSIFVKSYVYKRAKEMPVHVSQICIVLQFFFLISLAENDDGLCWSIGRKHEAVFFLFSFVLFVHSLTQPITPTLIFFVLTGYSLVISVHSLTQPFTPTLVFFFSSS